MDQERYVRGACFVVTCCVADVALWMKTEVFKRSPFGQKVADGYAEIFLKKKIDGVALLRDINDKSLRDDFGIKTARHRDFILQALATLSTEK